jgi:hypothetical protein
MKSKLTRILPSTPEQQAWERDAQRSFHHPRILIAQCKWYEFATAKLLIGFNVAVLIAFSSAIAQAAQIQGQPAPSAPTTFVPFNDFVQNVKDADTNSFLARPVAKVNDSAAFEEMRQHILSLYADVDVKHSYVLDSQTFDCIPVEQQPSLRALGLTKAATPPPAAATPNSPQGPGGTSTKSTRISQIPAGATTDGFGNSLGCETNTIPMRRVTLEELSHFKTLADFFQKGPNGAGHAPNAAKEIAPSIYAHKYSFTYQNVYNHGASTNINLWRPYVYTGSNEIFSLAQSWVVGTTWGTTQTAETGWQNYPAKYGSENPALFIYWTADGYNATGCYNLDCAAFVQTSSSLHLGAGFSSYSVYGGAQYEIQLQYYLYQGNWWLRVGGNWVGYYPGSIYRGGELTYYSNLLEFGSESVGTTVWPAEGSGLWAADGWTWAGYQRLIYYSNTSNTSIWTGLTAAVPSPACYTIAGPYWGGSSWGEYFYFGGPGGTQC